MTVLADPFVLKLHLYQTVFGFISCFILVVVIIDSTSMLLIGRPTSFSIDMHNSKSDEHCN